MENNMFTAGELAKYQNISKQTLLYYDKIGLFKPKYIDEANGYRYYGADQLDYLDSIIIMKKSGFSLEQIKEHLKNFTTENSLVFLNQQLEVIKDQISELSLIQNRLEHRISQVSGVFNKVNNLPFIEEVNETYLMIEKVLPPYGAKEISLATKQLYARALKDNLPIFFQCGVSVPQANIATQKFAEANLAYLVIEKDANCNDLRRLPSAKVAAIYHNGSYEDIGDSYQKLIKYCNDNHLKIISDSYEFCINDYITSKYENEFITKIIYYIDK